MHRDIRASNVLLDEEFGSHLMGVDLSKFVPWEVMHERTVEAASYQPVRLVVNDRKFPARTVFFSHTKPASRK